MSWYEVHKAEQLFARFGSTTIDGRYTLLQADGSNCPTSPSPVVIKILGHGGFGAVLRCKDRIGVDRAIKLVDPKKVPRNTSNIVESQLYSEGYTPSGDEAQDLSTELQDEIRHANVRPFKNLLPIIDSGEIQDADDKMLVYYVSPYVPGPTLYHFVRGFTDRTIEHPAPHNGLVVDLHDVHDVVLDLIDDLLAALAELADAGVAHLDINPRNAMVLPAPSGGRRPQLFVIDLGVAKSGRSTSHPRVRLIKTPYYFPEHLIPSLGYSRTDGKVDHSALVAFGPRVDLYSAGRTLEQLFLDRIRRSTKGVDHRQPVVTLEPAKERYWRAVFGEDFPVLEGLVDRLLTDGPERWRSADDARLAFATIGRWRAQSVLSSRSLTDETRGVRIKDGQTVVRIAPPFDEIVNHPVFQRLRRLQQLAMISEVFPDATHTRFTHSIRAFDLAKRYLLALNRDVRFRLVFKRRDVDHVLAAALLHDIGQYPFSHTIEDLRKLGDLRHISFLSEIRHDQELAPALFDRTDGAARSIRSVLEQHGYDVGEILYMFQKTPKEKGYSSAAQVGRDIISGVVDVDRISYLLHDSQRTGVAYGGAVDTGSLLEALCVRYEGSGEDPLDVGLGIEEAGISAAEAVLTAVYWMYRNVYWRHTNRAFMAAVKHVMMRLLEARALRFQDYVEATYGRTDWDALLFLRAKASAHAKESGQDVVDPLASLVERRRLGYGHVFSLGAEDGEDEALYRKVIGSVGPELMRKIEVDIALSLPGTNAREGEILVDIPLKRRVGEGTEDDGLRDTQAEAGARSTLWVRRKQSGRWVRMIDCSPLAAMLGRVEDHSGRRIRVFMSRPLLERASKTDEQLAERIREVVTGAVR